MSTQTLEKTPSANSSEIPARLCWFEIPADNVERARSFYSRLFGWNIKPMEGAGTPYWIIETGGADGAPDGGMTPRQHPAHGITNYVSVANVEEAAARVEQLGGKICMSKTAVPKMGYFVVCQDTENNSFALWEPNESAK